MKRAFFSISLLCLFFFVGIPSVRAENIQSFQTTISVEKDSSMTVVENILYDFGALEKHGIYREIPYTKKNEAGELYKMTIQNISVTNEQKIAYPMQKSTSSNYVTLKIGDANKTVTGLQQYMIGYKVVGAFVPFSDHDELYWNIIGNDWNVPIEKVSASILFPFTAAKENIQLACYTGVAGSTASDCDISYDNGMVSVEAKKYFFANEGLTVVIGIPKGLLTIVEAKKVNTWFADLMAKIVAIFFVILSLLWYIGLPLWVIVHWIRTGRDPKGTIGQAHVWFDVPKTKKGRGLTPGETGVLVDETADTKDIIATLIDFARRGYIKIVEKKKNDFYLEQIKTSIRGDTLEPFERTLLSGIFPGPTASVRIKDTDLSTVVQNTKNKLYEAVVTDGLFPKDPQKTRTIYMVIAGVALFTGNVGLALVAFFFGRAMPRKTLEGVNSARVANALKGFIVSQDRQYAFQAKKQLFFEKFLPFAIVFGVEKIWAERFADLHIAKPNWYETYDNRAFNTLVFMNSFSHGFSSNVVSSATPTRSSSGFSSGFSSGGGFSGGGGGGGGGGSW